MYLRKLGFWMRWEDVEDVAFREQEFMKWSGERHR